MEDDKNNFPQKAVPQVQKRMNMTTMAAVISAVFVAAASVLSVHLPGSFSAPEKRPVYAEYGTGFKKMAGQLDEEGLLRNRLLFEAMGFITGVYSKLKAGEYEFSTADSMADIMNKMERGDVLRYRVVIPEGSDLSDIGRALAAAKVADEALFLGLAKDPEFLKSIGINLTSAEGVLFPDTYSFIRGEGERRIISSMWARFKEKSPVDINRTYTVAGLSMSGYRLVKLASIIEKETKFDYERPTVASVFYNRMKSPEAYMRRLESCATVRYALNKKTGPLTNKDTRVDSPYNTYIILGLPPTPICGPGAKSIEAALRPADTNYRFFVARESGEHTFSETLEGHEGAKRERKKIIRMKNK